MGKRSTKENKNIYQLAREDAGLTREKASEILQYISADRIEKIESEKSSPHPDEILAMGQCYKRPDFSNYYCSHECPIGRESVPELELKDLSQIVLEMLSTLNTIEKQRNRLIDITVDGEISEDEFTDFASIQETLNKISLSVDSLKLWVQNQILQGNIDKDSWNSFQNKEDH